MYFLLDLKPRVYVQCSSCIIDSSFLTRKVKIGFLFYFSVMLGVKIGTYISFILVLTLPLQTDWKSFDKNTTGSLAYKSLRAQQPKHRNR